ncbi:phage antirepressor KilAC domain-containing protein, partial [Nocardia sp. NPDC019302]|uniref:phage antirepressor KilAC domain-containing protein n=1 Tax=Nocardia sp. NPDC019302 TaxID=3154592 RepID=UPI0033E6438F
ADAAKILSRDPAISIGQNRLFEFMAEQKWVFRGGHRGAWKAYQTQIDNGRLAEKPGRTFYHPPTKRIRKADPTIRITAKGLAELHKRLGGGTQLALVPGGVA